MFVGASLEFVALLPSDIHLLCAMRLEEAVGALTRATGGDWKIEAGVELRWRFHFTYWPIGAYTQRVEGLQNLTSALRETKKWRGVITKESWSSEVFWRVEEDGSQKSNITALASVKASKCAVAMAKPCQDRELKHEPGLSDQFLTAHDSWSLVAEESPGASSSSSSTPLPSPSSVYYSSRIESMIENRSKYSSELQFAIEFSRDHWSEVDPTWQIEHSGEMNCKYFEKLKFREQKIIAKFEKQSLGEKFRGLFREMDDLVVGNKIGEGAQAEIYEPGEKYVVKVFKAGYFLQDLEKQWPVGMLSTFSRLGYRFGHWSSMQSATLLKDERFLDRFAFVMDRCWGDLRKLIDQQMVQSSNRGPPFTTKQVLWFICHIAEDILFLHMHDPPILHRDLKAANILVKGTTCPFVSEEGLYFATVADYECSVGVVGTGFWRAPEILQQFKNRDPDSPLDLVFTEKCDVYSFGMTCYELVTGCIPFEGHSHRDHDLVLSGTRPELPSDLDPLLKEIIISCWDSNPLKRPSFLDIFVMLKKSYGSHYSERAQFN